MKQTATLYARARGGMERRSIEHQLAVCRQAADRMGARVVAEYVEQESAGRRPVLDDMIRRLTGKKATDLLIVASADRLTRRQDAWRRMSRCLTCAGTHLVAADFVGQTDVLQLSALIRYTAERQHRPRREEDGCV